MDSLSIEIFTTGKNAHNLYSALKVKVISTFLKDKSSFSVLKKFHVSSCLLGIYLI